MINIQKKTLVAILVACLVLLPLTGCFIFGGQTIYEDPEHVDFDGEDNPIEEGADIDSAEHTADDANDA